MLGTTKITNPKPTPYATRADFCRIFAKDMNRLYLLSFLLTANHTTAEKCFVSGLDASGTGNPVFKEWAQSWARRTIIQNAIRRIRPRPTDGGTPSPAPKDSASYPVTQCAEIAAVIQLPAFERFTFVMSVLEGYSDQECSLLLGCTRGEVIAARTRTLQQIGRLADLRSRLTSIESKEQLPGIESALQPEARSPLAVSA
jgi:DNA-directed RNA polymerase specialized sigma24 family protein